VPRYRNQHGQSDTSQLITIARYLKDKWHLQFKREWYVGFDKRTGKVRNITQSVTYNERNLYRWRNPDLLHIHRTRGLIIIEIDGSIHDKKTSATSRRNEQYEQGDIKLIVINLRNIKFAGKTVEETLDYKLEQLFKGV